MPKSFIIVPVDGATNIKLEVLDFETLATVYSKTTSTPVKTVDGFNYNCTETEFEWFDEMILQMPAELKNAEVIAPVSRGASGGLIGEDNTLCEVPGEGLTLAYTQRYTDIVENRFKELVGPAEEFYLETGSVRDLPGSLTLIKRFVFEEIERPDLLSAAAAFGTYPILMSGHFLDDYLKAARSAGNEHSYWMCHAGARNINAEPGTLSSIAKKLNSFSRLVPDKQTVCYKPVDRMPEPFSKKLCLGKNPCVTPGGHDTCLSHIPIMSTFYQAFQKQTGKPVIQIDAGTWTMTAQIGGAQNVPPDGFKKDIIVQGTVDGEPVVTGKYGGGIDFKFIKKLFENRGITFETRYDPSLLKKVLSDQDCFVMPNVNPENHGTGPFPALKGKIINEDAFFENPGKAYIITNLATAIITAYHVDEISKNREIPVVVTAGASKDVYFVRILASLTGRRTYTMLDKHKNAVTETTTLGAAIAGKAACLGIHPYEVDVKGLGVSYRQIEPFNDDIIKLLEKYREAFFNKIQEM